MHGSRRIPARGAIVLIVVTSAIGIIAFDRELREVVGEPPARRLALGLAQLFEQGAHRRLGGEPLTLGDAERYAAPRERRFEQR